MPSHSSNMTALLCVVLTSDSERKSSGLVALRCAFPELKHDGIAVRHAQYPTASGRARGCLHHGVPSHNYKMAASRCAIYISMEERKSSRRARVQEELKHDLLRCGMFIYPTACGRAG